MKIRVVAPDCPNQLLAVPQSFSNIRYNLYYIVGDTNGSLLWDLFRDVIHDPSQAQIDCHKPKPILLDTGEITFPYPWQPKIIPLQMFAVGQLVIIGVPAEFS